MMEFEGHKYLQNPSSNRFFCMLVLSSVNGNWVNKENHLLVEQTESKASVIW